MGAGFFDRVERVERVETPSLRLAHRTNLAKHSLAISTRGLGGLE
jgi:hypothetical protein